MMWFVVAIEVISAVLMYQPDPGLSQCMEANWESSLDHPGWSVCPRDNMYIKGLWRNKNSPGDERVGRIEKARCCPGTGDYRLEAATCRNADWSRTLDGKNVWALCPNGYYLEGLRVSGKQLLNIEEGKCCRPQNHPESYDHCYDEDVTYKFDKEGWSFCNQYGTDYFMTGLYKSDCEELYCIEKFKCCRMKKPVINGGWSPFGAWGQCSATCGDGQQERMRTCTNPPPSNGGAQCSGSNKETRPCNNGPCAVNGGWSDFGAWSKCSTTCGTGTQERWRTCTNPPPSNGGAKCAGSSKEMKQCRNRPCAVNGGWSDFGAWGQCSATCGAGQHERMRTCTNPPPSNGGAQCSGSNKETRPCNGGPCTVNGGWSDFGAWGECSPACGDGHQERMRTCTNPPPSNGGAQCSGPSKESKSCYNGPCHVNGGWSDFGAWGECSVTCGDGQQERMRTCTNPPPSGGGAKCSGPNKETKSCNKGACSVDGGWSDFGDWSRCSVTCGGGKMVRTRTCTNPPPGHGGKDCVGNNKQEKKCNPDPCHAPNIDGGFTQWSEFSACSKTCGKGKYVRTRTCTNPPPSGRGKNCKGAYSETKRCKVRSCRGL